MNVAALWNLISAARGILPPPELSFARLSNDTGNLAPSRWMASTAVRSCGAWACETSLITGGKTPVRIRSCPYLSNLVEQDHRRAKSRIQPMLGFMKLSNARRVLLGIEFVQKILKGQ